MQTKTASRLSTAYAALLTLRPCRPVLTLEIAASLGQARPGPARRAATALNFPGFRPIAGGLTR
jgi:hypothetical protein